MTANVTHEIDFTGSGNSYTVVPQPVNFDSAEVDIIFTQDKARASFANLQLVWLGDTAKKLFAVYEAGKQGGKGVAHGLPYRIRICSPGLKSIDFNFFLVLGHSSAKWSCDKVECPAWVAQGDDWLEKELQGNDFWFLFRKGIITQSDFKLTPYVITSIPNNTQVVQLTFNTLIMVFWVSDQIQELIESGSEIGADAAESSVPIAGTPHVAVTVVHIVSIILRILFIAAAFISILTMIKEIIANYFQLKKYKKCMREIDIWQKVAAALNVPFTTNILTGNFINATYMPAKEVIPKIGQNVLDNLVHSLFDRPEDEANTSKTYGYPDMRLDEWVRFQEEKYNGETKMINGVLNFNLKNSYNNPNPYLLPNTSELGYTFNLPQPFRTNLHELAPSYFVKFRIDETEINTLQRYRGTTAAVRIADSFGVTKYSGWGQGRIIDLGTALGKRKDFLTKVEFKLNNFINDIHNIVQVFINAMNLVISGLNLVISGINGLINLWNNIAPNNWSLPTIPPIPSVSNPIPFNAIFLRIGWLEIEKDSFAVPKTFIGINQGGDWELHPQTESIMSAINILNTFHGTNLATRGNQHLIFENNRTHFCCSDFKKIQNSNILKTHSGKSGKFDTMKWNLSKEIATDIVYRVKETYLTGLSEQIIIDGTP
jgi:hypothetical protein